MQIINKKYLNLNDFGEKKSEYFLKNKPFPHIVNKELFNPIFLTEVLNEFPDLSNRQAFIKKNNFQVGKFYTGDETYFSTNTLILFHYLNSQPFLEYLQKLTGIKEKLFGDPYYFGGGLHQTKSGGWLKIHSDFKKHPYSNLDRRINMIIFLNKDWKDSFGGNLELWDRNMQKCEQIIPPTFNTSVIFKTTDYSNHGYPDPINCPNHISRKSIALYYYSNGRPENEINYKIRQKKDKTYWKPRHKNLTDKSDFNIKSSTLYLVISFLRKLIPGKIFSIYYKLKNQ